MDKFAEIIRQQAEHHGKEHLRLNRLIEEIEDNCSHQFPKYPKHNDSHYEYFECEICGMIEKQ
jgi:hypothetical protein